MDKTFLNHAALRAAWLAAACTCCCLLPVRPAAAQAEATLEGRVVATTSSEPIVGATVTLAGTSIGAVTDDDGGYRIAGLVPGPYVVNVTSVGWEPATRSVDLSAGATVRADFSLGVGSVLLPGVVVSATRAPERAERVAATVHVLPREQVQMSPARAVDDLLREMPGVELPRPSGTVTGPEQIVSIRGMDEGRTLVLYDNVPLNDPWGEWVDWQRAPVYTLERVEVTEGGGSSLYGNYAMGGVIQLVSRPIEPHTVRAYVAGGNRDLKEASLAVSDIVGRLALSADGGIADGGGYVLVPEDQRGAIDVSSASTRRNANLRAEYALRADRTLSARLNFLDEDRDAGTPLAGSTRRIGGLSLGAGLGGVGGGRLTAELFGTLQRQESHQTRTAPDRGSETPVLTQTIPAKDLGGVLVWSREGERLALFSTGADFRLMHGSLDEDVFDATGDVVGTASSGGSQVVGGVFVQGVVAPVSPLRVEASLRLDAWHNYAGHRTESGAGTVDFDSRSDVALSPRLGVKYDVGGGFMLRGTAYRAFRAPALSQQYRRFVSGNTTFLPNPQLGPEHLTGVDAGFDWRPVPRFELRATVFANDMRGLASFTFMEPGILQRQNVGKAHSRGVEGEAAVQATDWLRLSASYNYDDAKTEEGERLHRVPLHRAVGRLAVGNARVGELAVIYRYEGSMLTLSGVELEPFSVVDVSARRALVGGLALSVGVENLTDETYLVNRVGELEQVGLPRTLRVGLSWTGL